MVDNNALGMQGGFADSLRARAARVGSWLCVGIDPDLARLPETIDRSPAGIMSFCRAVIEATLEYAAAFKLNTAFFEALGPDGWRVLAEVRHSIPIEVPVIADAKRGDIGNTAEAYAVAILDVLSFDALTVNPYLGMDSLEPFLRRAGKGVFVLCKTSNPGSADLQDLPVDGTPLYMHVARSVLALECPADACLVVGATQPNALRDVRALDEDAVLLLPGVGAQGANMADAVRWGANSSGQNALVPVSRQILFASSGADYAVEAAAAARRLAASSLGR